MTKKLLTLSYLLFCLIFLSLFGCGGPKKKDGLVTPAALATPTNNGSDATPDVQPAVKPDTRYVLGVGDVLNILYFEVYDIKVSDYRLNVRDEIEVKSSTHPDINSKLIIRPDGRVFLQRIGEVRVAGSTPGEVSKILDEMYSQTLRDPEVSVNVTKFHTAVDEMFKSLESFDSKQRIVVDVRADGYITLPMIGDIKAEGLTIKGLNDEITKQYSSKSIRLSTNVILSKAESRQVLVLGEVNSPGIYPLQRRDLGALEALSLAGGYKDSAELKSVMLIRKGDNETPQPILANLSEVLENGDTSQDIVLRPFDVVYVPKTSLDRVTTFFEKIYKLIPQNISFGFSYIFNQGALVVE